MKSRRWANWLETKYRDIADGNMLCRSLLIDSIFWLETKYRDIADSKQVYWWNQTAFLSCHQALRLLQTLGAIHCAHPNKSRLARKLGFLFSSRGCVQLLVEFGTDTRSIPTIHAWHKIDRLLNRIRSKFIGNQRSDQYLQYRHSASQRKHHHLRWNRRRVCFSINLCKQPWCAQQPKGYICGQ